MKISRADNKPYGGVLQRIVAYAIDVGFLFGILVLPQLVFSILTGGTLAAVLNLSSGLYAYVWLLLTISLPSWLYFAISDHSSKGATVGKRLLGMRVTDTDGRRLSFLLAVLRTIVKVIPWEFTHVIYFLPFLTTGEFGNPGVSIFFPYVLMVVYIAAIVLTPRKQSIHDLVVGTVVVKSKIQLLTSYFD